MCAYNCVGFVIRGHYIITVVAIYTMLLHLKFTLARRARDKLSETFASIYT